jgi:hypothetical protein
VGGRWRWYGRRGCECSVVDGVPEVGFVEYVGRLDPVC